MHSVRLDAPDDFDAWRRAARGLALAGVEPADIAWEVEGEAVDLFAGAHAAPPLPTPERPGFAVPKAFIELAETVILHRDPERFALLYTFLLKLIDQPDAIDNRADPLLQRLQAMARTVRRDIHKMRAFVRFREVLTPEGPRFVAWFEPEHHILRTNAGFFARRFASMHWSILTPEGSLHWDGETLTEGPPAVRGDAPQDDPVEAVWKSYYASIFNPARLKVGAMLKEMPRKYWRNMPETALVAGLVAGAQAREAAMISAQPVERRPVQERRHAMAGANRTAAWEALRDEARGCTRCDLYKCGTQTVFGEGPLEAPLLFVGEQPGDQEDLAGRPFVGPAGQLFDEALERAGVDRTRAYVTNAVKHFKYERRGKRRIHQTPDTPEIKACRWWLGQELDLIRPKIVVALGATAARSLIGKAVTISRTRGTPIELPDGAEGWVTVHPSYLLRIPDEVKKREERARFVEELHEIGKRAKALQ